MPRRPKPNYTSRLFKRFSQITGVPLRHLEPVRTKKQCECVAGDYRFKTHTYSAMEVKTKEHEMRHALQTLANPVLAKQILKSFDTKTFGEQHTRNMKWIERTNLNPKEKIISETFDDMDVFNIVGCFGASGLIADVFMRITDKYYTFKQAKPALILTALFLVPYLIAFGTKAKMRANVKRVYKKHGEDGILLLWVCPPEKKSVFQIPKWERKMVREGLLKAKGGMTRKGLQHFRRTLPSETIWQTLKQMTQERRRTKRKQKQ